MFLKAGTVWNLLKERAHSSHSPALSENLGSTAHMRGSLSGSTDEDTHTFLFWLCIQRLGGGVWEQWCRADGAGPFVVMWPCHAAGQAGPQETVQSREKNQALLQTIIPDLRSRTTWLRKQTYLSETPSFFPESSKHDFSSVKWAQYLPQGARPGQCPVNGHPPQMTVCTQDRSCPVLQACGWSISPLCCWRSLR